MRKLTVVYKWKSGKSGSFTHPNFPEPSDLGIAPDNTVLISLYWGWFRQVLVTWRADAKRLVDGNDSNAPMSYADAAKVMELEKVPLYAEPGESLTDDQKIDKMATAMTPAQIARFLAAAGITEYSR